MPISFIPYTAVYGPLSLPGVTCTLWLDAADTSQLVLSGTNVTTWKDKSGFGNSCSNITAGTSITYPGTIVNGLNTVGFTGGCIRGAFNGASANTGTNVTVFMVAAKGGTGVSTTRTFALSDASYIDDSTSTFLIYGPGTTTIQYFRAQYTTGYTIIANTTFLYTVTQTSGSGAQYFNGGSVQTDTITTASFAVTNYNIGTTRFSNSQNYYGPVSEVIVYNAFLGDTQRQAIEGYLAQKWGLTSQLPPGHPGLTQTLYNSRVYAPRIPQQNAPYTKNYFPLSIAACALWLDGADPAGTGTPPANGATVSTWIDKSTNKANGTAAGGTVTYNSSEKGLTFTGSYFSLPNNTISPGAAYYTIFCIVKATNLSNYPYLWFAGTGGPAGQAMSLVFYPTGEVENGFWTDFMGLAPAGTVAINNRYMFSSAYNGAVVGRVLYKNGTSVVSGTPTTTKNTQSSSYVSTPGGSALTGIYNELIVFNRFLTTDERQSIEGYLAWKWGLQSSLISHPYSSQAPPTVISINPLQLGAPTLTAIGSASYANTAYYNVSPQAWNYNWQPYLQSLVAANSSGVTVTFSSSSVTGSGVGYYGGVLAPNGKIYCIHLGTSIGVIDPALNSITSFGTTTSSYAGGVLAPNGKIYCIPFNATSICVIDTSTNTTTAFGSVTGTGAGSLAYNGGVLAPNGNIYAIPRNATSVGVIDPDANTFTTFGTTPGTNAYAGGVLAPNGKIYCIPFSATSVGVIDPATNTFTTFGTAPGSTAYSGGVLAPNGKIYCIPSSSTSVGVIDPVANTFSSVSVSGTAPGGGAYAGGILAPNGKIYCISHNSGNIGIIDPVANTFTTFGSAPGGQAYIGAILAPNGNIYFIPYGTSSVCVISFTGLKQLPSSNYSLSAYTNKY